MFNSFNLIADLAAFSLYEVTAVDFVGENAFDGDGRPGSGWRSLETTFIPLSALTLVFGG